MGIGDGCSVSGGYSTKHTNRVKTSNHPLTYLNPKTHNPQGGVIMISHDREFMQALCTETWLVENGEVRRHVHARTHTDLFLLWPHSLFASVD